MAGRVSGGPANKAIARRLGVAIVTGRHPPGSVLPGEIELAEQTGVSRSVVRESMRTLAAKGLVESRPKTGTRVRERQFWNLLDTDILAWMFEAPPPAKFVRDLFELRMIVEPAAAELAAERRSASQLSLMGHALETMATQTLKTSEGQEADQRFHATLLEATNNELILNLAGGITAAVRWTTFFKYRAARRPRDPMPLHRSLFKAIADSDRAAARAAAIELILQAQQDTEAAL